MVSRGGNESIDIAVDSVGCDSTSAGLPSDSVTSVNFGGSKLSTNASTSNVRDSFSVFSVDGVRGFCGLYGL